MKDKFLLQKYTRLHSFKFEFSNIFWGEAHREWRIYPLAKSAMPPLAKKLVFHHSKIGKHWLPCLIIGIFTKLNFLATPPHNDMVDFNGFKTFLFHLKMHQNRWWLGLRPWPNSWAHRVPQTVGEDGNEGKDEFASNLNFLTTPLW